MNLRDLNTDSEPSLSDDFKNSLKHTSDFDDLGVPYFDRLAVLVGEGLASDAEKAEYDRLVNSSEEKRRAAELYKNCFAKPDMDIVFDGADSLKRGRAKVLPLFWKISAAAAVLVAGIFCLSRLQDNKPEICEIPQDAVVALLDISPSDYDPLLKSETKPGSKPEASMPKPDKNAASQSASESSAGSKQEPAKPDKADSKKPKDEQPKQELDMNNVNFNTPFLLTDDAHDNEAEPDDDETELAAVEQVEEDTEAISPEEPSKIKKAIASLGSRMKRKLPIWFNVKRDKDGNLDKIEMLTNSGTVTYYRNLSK